MEDKTAHGWSAILILIFITGVTFLFFHLYLRPPSPEEIDQERFTPQETPVVTVINPRRGPSDAKITIVEYGDFQCQACRDLSAVLDTVRLEHPDDVSIVWKDFPNEDLHNQSTPAAIAARCAAEQGKFWEYHDLLFTQSRLLNETTYLAIANALEMDTSSFLSCSEAKSTLPRVQHDFEEALRLSLTATPTIFINEERYTGSLDLAEVRNIIESILNE